MHGPAWSLPSYQGREIVLQPQQFRRDEEYRRARTQNLSAWRSQRLSFPEDDRGLRCRPYNEDHGLSELPAKDITMIEYMRK